MKNLDSLGNKVNAIIDSFLGTIAESIDNGDNESMVMGASRAYAYLKYIEQEKTPQGEALLFAVETLAGESTSYYLEKGNRSIVVAVRSKVEKELRILNSDPNNLKSNPDYIRGMQFFVDGRITQRKYLENGDETLANFRLFYAAARACFEKFGYQKGVDHCDNILMANMVNQEDFEENLRIGKEMEEETRNL